MPQSQPQVSQPQVSREVPQDPAQAVVGRVEAVGLKALAPHGPNPTRVPATKKPIEAEDFARFISSSRSPTRAEVQALFDLLPHENPPRASMTSSWVPSSFSTGLDRKGGGLIGLRSACAKFPASTEALTAFVRSNMPGHPFTTVSLYLNTGTRPHKDSKNAKLPNGILGVSDFKGGEVWVEAEGGDSVQVVDGTRLRGHLYAITSKPTYIHAYRDLHFTMPWKGKRLVIVAFSVADHSQAQAGDLAMLRGQGFLYWGGSSR